MSPDVISEQIDRNVVCMALRRGMLENDLSLKEAASRIQRSIGTVKRALNGSMGQRTAYRILKEFKANRIPSP